MADKLTPRQNELISEALVRIAETDRGQSEMPERLKTIRRAMVAELEAVTAETEIPSASVHRSISG